MDAVADVAFGLYRTGTEPLSTESVNHVKPYVVNVRLGRAQINFKMVVDMGALVLQCLRMSMMLNYQIIPFSLWK